MSKKKLSSKQSLLWVFLATLLISGVPYLFFFSYSIYKNRKLKDFNHQLSYLFQTGPKKNALPTQYLAEILDLSKDQPKHFFAFDEKRAEKNLMKSPFIIFAEVQKMKPNIVYVDYEIREPFAVLSDYENIAINKSGYIFPCEPIYEKKGLPEIFLGLPRFMEMEDEQKREGGSFEKALRCQHFELASKVLALFSQKQFKEYLEVKKIDVSNAFAPSFGQREIVVKIEERMQIVQNKMQSTYIFPKYLRLNEKDYEKQLSNFLVLSQKMRNDYRRQIQLTEDTPFEIRCKAKLLDFRIPQLAFIKDNE